MRILGMRKFKELKGSYTMENPRRSEFREKKKKKRLGILQGNELRLAPRDSKF